MRFIANPVIVEAWVITATSTNSVGPIMLYFDDRQPYVATAEMCSRYTPRAGDYLVQQGDGYLYVNPRDVFQRKYRRHEQHHAEPPEGGAQFMEEMARECREFEERMKSEIAAAHHFRNRVLKFLAGNYTVPSGAPTLSERTAERG